MRVLLTLLPALALAQTPPAATPAATPTSATTPAPTPAKKATTPAKKAPAAATAPANAAAPKPATAGAPAAAPAASATPKPATAGRGAPGRGAVVAPKPAAPPKPAPLATDEEKTIYALGLAISQNLNAFDLTPPEVEIVKRAISDAAAGKPEIELKDWGPKIQNLMSARGPAAAEKQRIRAAAEAEKQKGPSEAYLKMAAAAPGAVKTPPD